jgi:hypothetical protein
MRIGWAFSGGSTNFAFAAGPSDLVELAGEGFAGGAGWAKAAAAQKIIMAATKRVFLMKQVLVSVLSAEGARQF